MGEKIRESTKYLYGCVTLEQEVNLLYVMATKKLPYSQLRAITTALSFDSQKHAAVIKELLKPALNVDINPDELSKEFKKSSVEIGKLLNALTEEDDIDDEQISDLLKTLTNIEDLLHDLYAKFIESKLAEDYSNSLPEESGLTCENLKYILHVLKLDNLKHREMLIESLYFQSKNAQKNKDTTPLVRYQNPDAWVQL